MFSVFYCGLHPAQPGSPVKAARHAGEVVKLPMAKTALRLSRESFAFCYTALDGNVFARVARIRGNKRNKLKTFWNFFAETNVAEAAIVRREHS